jgi:hypothetical protein
LLLISLEVIEVVKPSGNACYWDVEQVCHWMRCVGMPQFVGIFQQAGIDGRVIASDLCADHLTFLGIPSVAHLHIMSVALELRHFYVEHCKDNNLSQGVKRF